MPILKASIKALRQSTSHTLRNRSAISRIKTAMKKVRSATAPEAAKTALATAIQTLDKAATKGFIPRRTADRYKSRLAAYVNKLTQK